MYPDIGLSPHAKLGDKISSGLRRLSRQIVTSRPSGGAAFAWACVALIVPTALKFALDASLSNVPPFLTYYPAVTIAALCLGFRFGLALAIASVALCDYLFIAPYGSWSLSLNDLIVSSLSLLGGGLVVATAGMLRAAALELQAAAAREHELNAELKHRVNNNLAVVQALASQTARMTAAGADFYEPFRDRLHALREAHDILSSTDWTSCDLPRLADRGLKPFLASGRVSVVGPGCTLPSQSCVALVLALHELGVNAMKFGALSVPEGRVEVAWSLEDDRLVLRWSEHSGPPVQAPTRRGLGARLLSPQQGLDGVILDYLPEGVRCTITIDGAFLAS
ncbi:MAG TPA: HWE histidine kinase domain-containing protein [Caulobacter sp.]|nr:HWE histidine kinase domain-containing protein [Caulobacter sp.]